MTCANFISLTILSLFVSLSMSMSEQQQTASNIIFVMLDDVGRADIGSFGAEWDTPNIDSFIEDSVTLSHHYIGYVCSASRSQFLTGRHSYHNGYGTLDVFDIQKIGAMPRGTPTIMEYLKHYGSYSTYGLGKWQLGNPSTENLAASRGFDYFWGFNGGMEDYYSKTRSLFEDYVDFVENLETTNKWSEGYSTDQYFDKMIDIIESHANNEETKDEPFFIYAGIQANHEPFPDYGTDTDADGELLVMTPYYQECYDNYQAKISMPYRVSVCEAILGVDAGMGRLIAKFSESPEMEAVWDNTIVVFTSDNGGAIDSGSCNYPLRGGKNTFFEGNQRVIAVVGGGKIPKSQQGVVLDGLVSNVDWFPTLLTFASLMPSDYIHAKFTTSTSMDSHSQKSSSSQLILDGYNMYDYIMSPDSSPIRDHVLFHIAPSLTDDDEDNKKQFVKHIGEYKLDDMDEIAIVFYDTKGSLWKYVSAAKSTNPVGSPVSNSGWCVTNDGTNILRKKSTYREDTDPSYVETYSLYNIDVDISEKINYLDKDSGEFNEWLTQDTGISWEFVTEELLSVISKKIHYYVNAENAGSENSDYLYGSFDCFTGADYVMTSTALAAAKINNGWTPFLELEEWKATIQDFCEINSYHKIYKLFADDFDFERDIHVMDNSDKIILLNENVPESMEARKFENNDEIFDLDNVFKSSQSGAINHNNNEDITVGTNEHMDVDKSFWIVAITFASLLVMFVAVAYANKIKTKLMNRDNGVMTTEYSSI